MKAFRYHRYGLPDVLELCEVDKPVAGDDDVLLRIHAASVNPFDWHVMTGTPYIARTQTGLRRPKSNTLGADVAGTVEAVGKNVTEFRPGDEVFGGSDGSFAEYVCVPENRVVPKPANVTFEQAAAVPIAACSALQGLRDVGELQAGQKVLVNGASGGVGTFTVQIAKSMGAEVTGVCSTKNVDMVRSLGADHVVDYTKDDFARTERRYDIMYDAVGNRSLADCRGVLTPDGIHVAATGPKPRWLGPVPFLIKGMLLSRVQSRKTKTLMAKLPTEDLSVLAGMLERGDVTPVIDRTFGLHQVPDALRYLGEGHVRGKAVIAVR